MIENVQIVVGDVGDVVQMFLARVYAEDSLSSATYKDIPTDPGRKLRKKNLS